MDAMGWTAAVPGAIVMVGSDPGQCMGMSEEMERIMKTKTYRVTFNKVGEEYPGDFLHIADGIIQDTNYVHNLCSSRREVVDFAIEVSDCDYFEGRLNACRTVISFRVMGHAPNHRTNYFHI